MGQLRQVATWVVVALLAACGARTELDREEHGILPHRDAGPGDHAPIAICPPDINTAPLTEVELVGAAQDDGFIVAWRWEVLGQPAGSSATNPAPAWAQVAYFTPDVAGEYPMRLTVTDDDGEQGSCDFRVRAIPSEEFRIEMYWNPPESQWDPTDVDLHLLHPAAPAWFDSWLDCHYMNCSVASSMVLDWDTMSWGGDDPRLDLDDVDGYGPENINIDSPVVGQPYTVGVHYFGDDGWGPSQVYVKIYCGLDNIDPIYEVGPVALIGDQSWELNQFWKVASVTWDGGGCTVQPIDLIVSTAEVLHGP